MDDRAGVCIHVCVRRDDGQLVDVTGAHTEAEVIRARPGVTMRSIDHECVYELCSGGWATPDVSAARAWVAAVLRRSDRSAELPPAAGATIQWTSGVVDGLQIRVRWEGDRYLDASVRRAASGGEGWVRYGQIALPRDPSSGRFVIDFTADRLEEHVDRWLPQFDSARAELKLRQVADERST